MKKEECNSVIAKAIGIKKGNVILAQLSFTPEGRCLVRIEVEPTPEQRKILVDLLFSSLKDIEEKSI